MEKSVLPNAKKKKKSEEPEITEEHDSILEYEQLTPGKFQDVYLTGDNKLMRALSLVEEADNMFVADSALMTDIEMKDGATGSGSVNPAIGNVSVTPATGSVSVTTATGSVSVTPATGSVSVTPTAIKIYAGNNKETHLPYVSVVKERNQGVDTSRESENPTLRNNTAGAGIAGKLKNSNDAGTLRVSSPVNTSDSSNISQNSRNTYVNNIQACGVSNSNNTQDTTLKPTVTGVSPHGDSQKGCGRSGTVTPGQKSSSDEDEVRSSTGDALMDHEHDFTNNDHWGESEEPLQIENTTL